MHKQSTHGKFFIRDNIYREDLVHTVLSSSGSLSEDDIKALWRLPIRTWIETITKDHFWWPCITSIRRSAYWWH